LLELFLVFSSCLTASWQLQPHCVQPPSLEGIIIVARLCVNEQQASKEQGLDADWSFSVAVLSLGSFSSTAQEIRSQAHTMQPNLTSSENVLCCIFDTLTAMLFHAGV
jgi:hypothetical protein